VVKPEVLCSNSQVLIQIAKTRTQLKWILPNVTLLALKTNTAETHDTQSINQAKEYGTCAIVWSTIIDFREPYYIELLRGTDGF
jgi:hypothetical protein